MKEIHANLFIASQEDLERLVNSENYSLCLCAKTYHQQIVGYIGNLDKLHREYLISNKIYESRTKTTTIAYNLIDAPNVNYIPDKIINHALRFIDHELEKNNKVIIACNQGKSRSACVGLMFLIAKNYFSSYNSFESVENVYRNIYPMYDPGAGMREYTKRFWDNYVLNGKEMQL